MSEKFKAFLTGKMFIKRDPKLKHGGSLQLEAVIEGERTRLYGESLPDDCLYDKRHKLFSLSYILTKQTYKFFNSSK